jgi:multidrug efflux pump subunit AcrB
VGAASHWNPWKPVDLVWRAFDDLTHLVHAAGVPWSLEHGKLVAVFCAGTFVLAISRWCGSARSVKSSFRRSIVARSSSRWRIRSERPSRRWRKALRSTSKKILATSDTFANTAVAGAYAASFGGFVSQNNVGQVHVWLKDDRKHSTSYWVTQFQAIAKGSFPPQATGRRRTVDRTGGGNAQPIDFLVTDVTGGDPTQYAVQVLNAAQESPGRNQRQQHRHAAHSGDFDQFDRNKAQALGVDLGQAAEAAGAAFGGNVATQFETTAGLEQVQVIYPQSYQTASSILRNRCDSLVERRSSTSATSLV